MVSFCAVSGQWGSICGCRFDAARFNKLGLDTITTGEEPNPSNQVEEVHSYRPVQSEPLCSERIIHLDIGTAHSVAVTGEIVAFHYLKKAPYLQGFHQFKFGFSSLEKGQCFTFGSNQHGQIGCSSRRSSRVPYQVPDLQGISMAACGDAFTLAIGSGELGLLMLTNSLRCQGSGLFVFFIHSLQKHDVFGNSVKCTGILANWLNTQAH